MKPQLNEEVKVKLDKLISKFNYSCMNNSKWKKLFMEILKNKKFIKRCEIYDFLNSCVNEIRFDEVSKNSFENVFNNYISEDILTGEYSRPYKYIEYIEFLKEWKNKPYSLAQFKIFKQDTDKIKEILSKIGLFEWDEDDRSLRILGYKQCNIVIT